MPVTDTSKDSILFFLSTLGDITGYRSMSHVYNALPVYDFYDLCYDLDKKSFS